MNHDFFCYVTTAPKGNDTHIPLGDIFIYKIICLIIQWFQENLL